MSWEKGNFLQELGGPEKENFEISPIVWWGGWLLTEIFIQAILDVNTCVEFEKAESLFLNTLNLSTVYSHYLKMNVLL